MWLVHAGNRIDAAGRIPPRFPASQVPIVEARLEKILGRLRPDAIVSAAASGADLLVLDVALRLAIPVHLSLPLPALEFRRRSVADQGEGWTERFDRVCLAAASISEHDLSAYDDWYLRGNDEILDDAVRLAGHAQLNALVVRPRNQSDSASATSDFARKASGRGLGVLDLDPLEPLGPARRQRALIVALVVVGAVLALLGKRQLDRPITACPDFHLATQLSASNARLQKSLQGCSLTVHQLRTTLLWDVVFLVGYGAAIAGLLLPFRARFRAGSPLRRPMALAWMLGPITASLDLCENIATAAFVRIDGNVPVYRGGRLGPLIVATFAWLKWLSAGAAGALVLVAVVFVLARATDRVDREHLDKWARKGPLRYPAKLITTTADRASVLVGRGIRMIEHNPNKDETPLDRSGTTTWTGDLPGQLGVCCSGGGIRAAAFSVGALTSLEKAGLIRRAAWLTAVSGGSYAATGWRLAKFGNIPVHREDATDVGTRVSGWLTSSETEHTKGRHRFLRNGPGGLGRAVSAALAYVLAYLLVEALAVYVFAWPLGRLLTSRAIAPDLRTDDGRLAGNHISEAGLGPSNA